MNLNDLLMVDANINKGNDILLIPEEIANILYGIGVKPDVKMRKKSYSLNWCWISKNNSLEKK